VPVPGTNQVTYNGSNQVTGVHENWGQTSLNGAYTYDLAGDVTNDITNQYAYDAEGRLCAVQNIIAKTVTQYIYDASGARVAKGTLSSWPSSCGAPTSSFTPTALYLLDQGGDQVTELNTKTGSMAWAHSNVFGGGHLDATYDTVGLHFHIADPLGSRRVQTNPAGAIEENILSLPFGNGLTTLPTALATADDATEHHFTGKERDAESGNDYFEARYYSSTMGRFMSPDWSAKEEPVPYAQLDDPQSLNLYSYVQNNPLIREDADGHTWGEALEYAAGVVQGVASSVTYGMVGAPSANDSAMSLSGQLAGSAAVMHISATALEASGPAAVGGIILAPETGGASLVVSGGAVATALVSSATLVGGAKNVAAVAMAAKAGGRFSPGTKQAAKGAAGGKCQICGKATTPGQKSQKGVTPPKNEGQTDHIKPASKGGTNDPSNAQHLCRECNLKKSDNY